MTEQKLADAAGRLKRADGQGRPTRRRLLPIGIVSAGLAGLVAAGASGSAHHLLKPTDARTRAAVLAAIPAGTPVGEASRRMTADGIACFDAHDAQGRRTDLLFCRKDETWLRLFPWTAQIMFVLREERTTGDVRVETGFFLPPAGEAP